MTVAHSAVVVTNLVSVNRKLHKVVDYLLRKQWGYCTAFYGLIFNLKSRFVKKSNPISFSNSSNTTYNSKNMSKHGVSN